MALKDIFKMTKANRYTADGREELIKAQEAVTEDRRYNIGEISEKTGLQKTANGWVKPKNGKQPGANKPAAGSKKIDYQVTEKGGKFYATGHQFSDGSQLHAGPFGSEKELHEFMNGSPYKSTAERNHGTEQKKRGPGAIHTPGKGNFGMDKMKEAAEKGLKGQELKEFMTGSKKEGNNTESKPAAENKTTIRQGPNTKTLNETPAEHVQKNLDAYKGYQPYDMEELVLGPSGYKKQTSARVPGGGQSITYTKNGAEDITLFFDIDGELENADIAAESKPAAEKPKTEKKQSLKLPDEKSSFSTDVNRMKKLKKEDYKQYTIQLEKLHSKYPINKWKDLLNKTTQDEAPRILTGDTRIRVRK